MMKSVLFLLLLTVVALGVAPGSAGLAAVATAQEAAPAPPAEAKPAPSPAPAQATPAPVSPEKAARVNQAQPMDPSKRPPRTLRTIVAEFRAVDLDKKMLTFETDDGKSYTVEAQVPKLPEAVDRAAQLAQILKPGDRIRMLCRVNERQEPTLILSLHMVGDTVPMQYR